MAATVGQGAVACARAATVGQGSAACSRYYNRLAATGATGHGDARRQPRVRQQARLPCGINHRILVATLASDAPAQVLASNKQRRQLTMMMVMGRMRGRMVRRIMRMSLGSVMRRGGGGG